MNFDKAKAAFNGYLTDYDLNDAKVRLKIVHTHQVILLCEFISKALGLGNEDIELAKLIALLHDIARFDQVKRFSHFVDAGICDHADAGIKILFETSRIRDFISDDCYDNIILKAIWNHNKYEIEEGLDGKELLHCKIIRDADKLDNFRVKAEDDFEDIASITKRSLENGSISDEVFIDFMACRQIAAHKRKTDLDFWVSIIAFVFDINFACSFEYIREKSYVNVLIDRIEYQNEEVQNKMEQIRKCATQHMARRLRASGLGAETSKGGESTCWNYTA
ncbi:MAG: HD domain-containing protein [Firmicutes bacterium]|nr:HD domain-containing protein [Bacillota bacterium]